MIDFNSQAEAIRAKVATVAGVNTARHIGDSGSVRRRPSILPEVTVAMGRTDLKDGANQRYSAKVDWVIMVRATKMAGDGQALDLVDLVLDALSGFQPAAGFLPLVPVSAEFFDRDGRADCAYILTFQSTVSNVTVGNPC